MNANTLLEHFERISEAPDAIAQLRRFILDLAVRGKLVEQDPNDEPASELLKQIQHVKARLVKDKKHDGMIAAQEIPFGIPSGWTWARVGNLCSKTGSGSTPRGGKETYAVSGIPLLRSQNIHNDGLNLEGLAYISDEIHERMKGTAVNPGDLLLNITGGSIGRCTIVPDNFKIGNVSQHVAIIRPAIEELNCFLHKVITSPYFQSKIILGQTGAGRGGLPKNRMDNIVVPLPPLVEQHRIVTKVDELMGRCDHLEAAKAEREQTRDRLVSVSLHYLNPPSYDEEANTSEAMRDHARFVLTNLPRLTTRREHIKQLRQTILNLAVCGKLVPQNTDDEPAKELLRRIRDEKAGNGKKYQGLPGLDGIEPPFTLPSGWAWARFPELGIFGRGKSKHRPRNDPALYEGGTHPLVQTGDVARSNGLIETYTGKYNDHGLAQSEKWPKGTLCITIAANIADSGILTFDACFPDSVVGFIPAAIFPDARYFEYYLRTVKENLSEVAPATAQKNINLGVLNAVLVPLPPLAEQQRIVAKVDELMALCDQLEAQITNIEADNRLLLEAVLHETLQPAQEEAFACNAPSAALSSTELPTDLGQGITPASTFP